MALDVLATYEVVIEEKRKYVILADGSNLEAIEEDAMLRFHRLAKSGELVAYAVSNPVIRSVERLKNDTKNTPK